MSSINKRLTQAEKICKSLGARLTPIRRQVLTLIYSHKEHLTAYTLLSLLRENHPKAESMTIYRALEFLQQHHFIHRVASMNAYVACEIPEESHSPQLLLCEKCHQGKEINNPLLQNALQQITRQYDFYLSEKPIEIVGVCKKCFHLNQ